MYLHARQVIRVMRGGSSRPMLVETSDGGRYLLKPRGSLSNPWASVSDFLCGKMGVHAGLPVCNPQWVRLDAHTDVRALDDEMRDVAQKSEGLNVAYPFVEDAKDGVAADLEVDDEVLRRLFVLDLFLLNVDRTPYNVNLLKTPAGDWLSFDYETSMRVLGAIHRRSYEEQEFVAKALRQSPLYQSEVFENEVVALLERLKTLDLKALLVQLPDEWAYPGEDFRERLEQTLTAAFKSPQQHLAVLERARAVETETNEQRRARQLENRRKFENDFYQSRQFKS